jgi:hypothetical protein
MDWLTSCRLAGTDDAQNLLAGQNLARPVLRAVGYRLEPLQRTMLYPSLPFFQQIPC